MAHYTVVKNPLRILDRDEYFYDGTIIDFLQEKAPEGFNGFIRVFLNKEEVEIPDLDIEIGAHDKIVIMVMPTGPALPFIWQALIALAVSYVLTKLFTPDIPTGPLSPDEPNTIYSLSANQNAAKVGEVIPVIYGEAITTPDYASQPYTSFDEAIVTNLLPDKFDLSWGGQIESPVNVFVAIGDPLTGDFQYYQIYENLSHAITIYQGWVIFYGAAQTRLLPAPIGGTLTPVGDSTTPGKTVVLRDAIDGDQWLYYLLSIGAGEHTIDIANGAVLLGDVKTSDLPSGEIEVRDYTQAAHNNVITSISSDFNAAISGGSEFHENVHTAIGVGGVEFNEAMESAWFPLGDKPVDKISLDIIFDRGFYKIKDNGDFEVLDVDIEVRFRIKGTTTTDAREILFRNNKNENVSPFRRTLTFNMATEVYVVQVARITPKRDTDGKSSDIFTWGGLRGFIVDVVTKPVYGDTHLLAMRIKATDLVSAAAARRIRVKAFRKIKGLDSVVAETNNPSDIISDIMLNSDYGANRPLKELDVDLLTKLHTRWGGKKTIYGFNGVFNARFTIFDALRTVLAPVTALPLPIGSEISSKYSGKRSAMVQLFNEANIVDGSFSISYSFDTVASENGYSIEYRNPDTWQKEFATYPVTPTDPSKPIVPKRIVLIGCTDKGAALQMAQFMWQKKKYNRKVVSFNTELEGLIPRAGDKIGVQHSLADWGVGGLVISYDSAARNLKLDQDVTFGGGTYFVLIRNTDGSKSGPFEVTQVSGDTVHFVNPVGVTINSSIDINPTMYCFGEGDKQVEEFIVEDLEHDGNLQVKVTAVAYNELAFQGVMPYLLTEV